MFLSTDLPWEYCIELVAIDLHCIFIGFTFPTGTNICGISGFVTGCPCGAWCCGLTTHPFFMLVHFFGKALLNVLFCKLDIMEKYFPLLCIYLRLTCAWCAAHSKILGASIHPSLHTYIHTYTFTHIHTYIHACSLLLISMLWHRQAIFESKGDKLSSSAESRIRTHQGLRHQIASRLNAHWQTDWAIEDQAKTWTRQPVPMISEHSAHLTPQPFWHSHWLWRYTCLLLISMLWHRQAIFKSIGDKLCKLCSSAECRIWTRGPRHQFASRLNARWQTDWAIEDQAKNLNSTARPYDQRAFSPLGPTVSWLSHLALAIYVFVVVNFDALAQASDIQIERRQVVFLCWMQDLNPGPQTPIRQQTECSLTNRLSYRGSS